LSKYGLPAKRLLSIVALAPNKSSSLSSKQNSLKLGSNSSIFLPLVGEVVRATSVAYPSTYCIGILESPCFSYGEYVN